MWEKFIQDLKVNFLSYDLMPLKFLFFMMYAANMALVPFLAVHLQSLGFGADKAAVVYAIIPLVAILGPPIAGAIADKIGNFKMFFSFMVVASGGLALPLLLVPSVPHPPGLVMTFLTDNSINELAERIVLSEKGKLVDAEYLQFLLITNQTGCDIPEEYHTTMDGIREVKIFDAEPKSSTNITRILRKGNVTLMALTTHHPIACLNNTRKSLPKYAAALLPEILNDYNVSALNMTVGGSVANYSSAAWWRSGCPAKVPGLCIPHQKNLVAAEAFSFWSYLGVRALLNIATNAGFTLFEGATLSLIKAHEGDYGFQRMWGYIGTMLLTPFSGWTIDYFSKKNEAADFRSAFYIFLVLQILAGLIALSVNLEFKSPSKRVLKNIYQFLTNFEVIMLFVAMFLAGAFFGFLEAFLFWFLGDIGASRSLMGLTITVGAGTAVPFVVFSSYITERFGYANVIGISFLMYSIRFAGYACINDPYHSMYFESLEGITTGLLMSTAMLYAAELSTTESVVSLQALCATVHHGIGKGVGSLVGGYMYYHMGARKTFRMMTVYSMLASIAFFIYNLYLRQKRSRMGSVRRKSAAIERVQSIKLIKERQRASKRMSKMDRSELEDMERHMSAKSFKSLVSQTSVESTEEREMLVRNMSSRSFSSNISSNAVRNLEIRKMGGQSYTILSANEGSDSDSDIGEALLHMGTQTTDADWKMLKKVNTKKHKPKKRSSKTKLYDLPVSRQSSVVQVEQETQVEPLPYHDNRRGTLVEQDETESQGVGVEVENEIACQTMNVVDVDIQHEVACQSSNDILSNEESDEEVIAVPSNDRSVYFRQDTIGGEEETQPAEDKCNEEPTIYPDLSNLEKVEISEDKADNDSIKYIDQDVQSENDNNENNEYGTEKEKELPKEDLDLVTNHDIDTGETIPLDSDQQEVQDSGECSVESSKDVEDNIPNVNEVNSTYENEKANLNNSMDRINGVDVTEEDEGKNSQIENIVQTNEIQEKELDNHLENKARIDIPSDSLYNNKEEVQKNLEQNDVGLETNQNDVGIESTNCK